MSRLNIMVRRWSHDYKDLLKEILKLRESVTATQGFGMEQLQARDNMVL